jgi:sugar transferase (PEP-CTERM/EpsH1 system associated)
VPVRINGAHGRDAADPTGSNRKHNALRRMMVPFYDCCYANSADMQNWNRDVIKVPEHKSRMLANGIDAEKFHPRAPGQGRQLLPFDDDCCVIGTVGRVQDVKDHASLLDAFVLLRQRLPAHAAKLRLAIVGDGPLLAALRARAQEAGVTEFTWFPGARTDIALLLREFDIFAMSSIAEGTPGSALEAMASALPVVGTRVGGIPEVIADGVTGTLVPPSDPAAMASALAAYVQDRARAAAHGAAGRERLLRLYNMTAMVAAYESLYDALCERKTSFRKPKQPCVE